MLPPPHKSNTHWHSLLALPFRSGMRRLPERHGCLAGYPTYPMWRTLSVATGRKYCTSCVFQARPLPRLRLSVADGPCCTSTRRQLSQFAATVASPVGRAAELRVHRRFPASKRHATNPAGALHRVCRSIDPSMCEDAIIQQHTAPAPPIAPESAGASMALDRVSDSTLEVHRTRSGAVARPSIRAAHKHMPFRAHAHTCTYRCSTRLVRWASDTRETK